MWYNFGLVENINNEGETLVVPIDKKGGELTPDQIKEILKEIEGLVNNADKDSLKKAEEKLALIDKQMNEIQEEMKEANEKRKEEEKTGDKFGEF